MLPIDKLETLVSDAEFDICGCGGIGRTNSSALHFIHHAAVPGHGTIPLFKVLLTNVCINDCAYCVNRIGVDRPRSSFKPEELARLFMELHSKKLVKGLFLTSGIAGNPSHAMEAMVKTVEILRYHHEFKGYIHLKVLPGASFDCIEAGCRLASRVSVNVEAPTAQHLAKLSSKKDLHLDILERMRWVKEIISKNERLVPAGQTTQFVAGAAGESDRDILHTTETLYSEIGLKRVYYSAFQPVGDPRLEMVMPTPPLREHRLYQADWLLRVYNFSPQELESALSENGYLSLRTDPKSTIARKKPWLFPVDVNIASYEELIRVPGIGPLSAKKIIETRKNHSIFSLQQIRKLHIPLKQATPYIWFRGMSIWDKQISFLTRIDDETDQKEFLQIPATTSAVV